MIDAHDIGPDTLEQHFAWLERHCAQLSGHANAGQDLAQETLIEAWRNRHKLRDAGNERAWLAAIARNVCARWRRTEVRMSRLYVPLDITGDIDFPADAPESQDTDPVWSSEQRELYDLIEEAMAFLPDPARRLLIDRYGADRSVAEIARSREQSAPHVAVQLQRARGKLKAVLLDRFPEEFRSFAPDGSGARSWHATRLWCPRCGKQRLESILEPGEGIFTLRCLACAPGPGALLFNWEEDVAGTAGVLSSARSAPQALDRTLRTKPRFLPTPIDGPRPPCPHCQRPVWPKIVRSGVDADELADLLIEIWCDACGYLSTSATFSGLALFCETGVQFWRTHGRIVTSDVSRIERDGVDAIRVTMRSVTSSHSLTTVLSADSAQLLLVAPAG